MRKYLGYIAAGIAAIAAFVLYLLNSNKGLKDKIGQLEGDKVLHDKIEAKDKAVFDADDAESEYMRLRAEYLRSTNGSGGDTES